MDAFSHKSRGVLTALNLLSKLDLKKIIAAKTLVTAALSTKEKQYKRNTLTFSRVQITVF